MHAKYRPSPLLNAYLPVIRAGLRAGPGAEPLAIRLAGPTGSGKTEAAAWLADALGATLLTVDCSVVREPRDLLGSVIYDGSRTRWDDSPFAAGIQRGHGVVLLDELNRASEAVANALLPLLDRRGATIIQERGAPIVAGPGLVWLATTNIGAEYSGTYGLDRAIRDRFSRTIELAYLRPAEEADLLSERTGLDHARAVDLVQVASATREADSRWTHALSTRALLAAASDLASGGPDTLAATVLAQYSGEGGTGSDRAAMRALLVGRGLLGVADGGAA